MTTAERTVDKLIGDERHRASKEAAFTAIPGLVAELSSRLPGYGRAEPAFAS